MSHPLAFLLPLLAGFLYVLASLFLKRALAHGAGAMRLTFFSNWMAVFTCLPLFLFIEDASINWAHLWAPIACSVFVLLGWSFAFLAIRFGDITLQSPLMSIKVIIVAALTVLFIEGSVPMQWWIAGGLVVVAMFLMSKTDGSLLHRKTVINTFLFCMGSAGSFATCEVIMQREAPYFGKLFFVLIMTSATAIESFVLIPFFRGGLFQIVPQARTWVFWGTFLMGFEAMLLYVAICFFGKATVVNILYSSRGLWSIVLVYILGQWFASSERRLGKGILGRRLAGALLLCCAIGLVMAE